MLTKQNTSFSSLIQTIGFFGFGIHFSMSLLYVLGGILFNCCGGCRVLEKKWFLCAKMSKSFYLFFVFFVIELFIHTFSYWREQNDLNYHRNWKKLMYLLDSWWLLIIYFWLCYSLSFWLETLQNKLNKFQGVNIFR